MSPVRPNAQSTDLLVVLDGRIHNCRELSQEISDASSAGAVLEDDAPSLIAGGYRLWGRTFFQKLVGDWAIAVYDSAQNEVLLARDFPGARTLFYANSPEGVIWATDLEIIGGQNGFSEIDSDYCIHFITSVCGSLRTPYRNVLQMCAGGGLAVGNRSARTFRSYSIPENIPRIEYQSEPVENSFRRIFYRAVGDRIAGERCAALLSGGYDSSSIVCSARQLSEHNGLRPETLTTITIHYDDETARLDKLYAEIVSDYVGYSNVVIDQKRADPWFATSDALPLPCVPPIPAFQTTGLSEVCRERRVTQLLSGEGGDVIGVSSVRPFTRLGDLWRSRSLWNFQRELRHASRCLGHSAWRLFIEDAIQERTRAMTALSTGTFWGPNRPRPKAPWIKRFVPPDIKYEMSVLEKMNNSQLRFCVGIEMFHQMLARDFFGFLRPVRASYPFLDRRLIEFAYSLPIEEKITADESRRLHKRAMQGVVPPELLNRGRKSTIDGAVVREIRRSWDTIESSFGPTCLLAQYGVVDLDSVNKAIRALREGCSGRSTVAVYRAVIMELWLRRYDHQHELMHS